MSSVFNTNDDQLVDVTTQVQKPCPSVSPYALSFFQVSSIGWNAVLVGLLSSILAIVFLLTCLYYFLYRRRYNDLSEIPTSVGLIEKNGDIPVTNSSQTATTTFINESGKETIVTTYSEQGKTSTTNGNLVVNGSNLTNGHTGTNGVLANGSADPSELRLLQHEHN